MHFLYVLLQLLLERLVPAWRDGLKMAARADGRVEQVPADFWGSWQRWWRQRESRAVGLAEKVLLRGDAARRRRR